MMIKTNGKNAADPDYDDYGFSDFISDYVPDDDVIIEWINESPGTVLVAIAEYGEFSSKNLGAAWVDTHQDEIEDEWNSRGDDQ